MAKPRPTLGGDYPRAYIESEESVAILIIYPVFFVRSYTQCGTYSRTRLPRSYPFSVVSVLFQLFTLDLSGLEFS